MSVGDYCRREVWTVRPDQTVREAARLMAKQDLGLVIAVDAGKPIGVLSDRDIAIDVLRGGLDADAVRVRDLMRTPLESVVETAPLADALGRMRARGVRRLAVLSGRGELAGVISADDIALILARELELASHPISAQRVTPPTSLEEIHREQAIDRSE